jgi:hypothetical protein
LIYRDERTTKQLDALRKVKIQISGATSLPEQVDAVLDLKTTFGKQRLSAMTGLVVS